MKILYFTRDFNAHDQRFTSTLAETSHQVTLLRLESQPFTLIPRQIAPGVEEVKWVGGNDRFSWSRTMEYVKDLKRVIAEVKPDVIHAGPVHMCAYLAELAGFKRLVTMSWASDILHEVKLDRTLARTARYALKRTSVLVGDCQAMANKAIEVYRFPPERIVLFPWGVDLDLFKPNGVPYLRSELGWNDAFVCLCLRSWEPVYGVDLVVEAFARAVREVPYLRLLLYGSGSQNDLIRGMIASNALEEKVFLGGKVNNAELPAVYRSADVYLTAAHSDGSSVSLMEALACGLPSVVSDIPGNLEWVENDKHGWVFPDGNASALAAAMIDAYTQRKKLKDYLRNARLLAETKADWKKNFQELLRAYEMAVETAI